MSKPPPPFLSVTVDRIEDGLAILLCGEETLYEWPLPAHWLPEGTREGECLSCRLKRDPKATQSRQVRNAALIADLLAPNDKTPPDSAS